MTSIPDVVTDSKGLFALEIPDIEMIEIKSGSFTMGPGPLQLSKKPNDLLAKVSPNPAHEVHLDTYQISKYLITNEQYYVFVKDIGHRHPITWKDGFPSELSNHPVTGVTWSDAWLFTRWLSMKTGKPYHLPTEAEWEKAATWNPATEEKQLFPWGDDDDRSKVNLSGSTGGETSPVGSYSPEGDSPYGVTDMIGNVQEWCNSVYKDYPYIAWDFRERLTNRGQRAQRGRSSDSWNINMLPANERKPLMELWTDQWGFRIVLGDSLKVAEKEFAKRIDAALQDTYKGWEKETVGTDIPVSHIKGGQLKLESYIEGFYSDLESALGDYDIAIKYGLKNPSTIPCSLYHIYYNRGLCNFYLHHYQDAIEDFSESLRLAPEDPDNYVMRSNCYARMKMLAELKSDIQEVILLVGKLPDWASHLEIYLDFEKGKYEEVLKDCTKYLESFFYQPILETEFYLLRAQVYFEQKEYCKGLSDLYHYVLCEPDTPESEKLRKSLSDLGAMFKEK